MTMKTLNPNAKYVGYARISKRDMNEARQLNRLKEQCDQVYVEKLSACRKTRPIFDMLIAGLAPSQTLTILDLDRAFRSTKDAILTAERLKERGVNLKIINLNIDLATDMGEVIYGVMAIFAQFERRTLIRRTREGLQAAQERGSKLGRPRKLSDKQIRKAHDLVSKRKIATYRVAKKFGVAHSTLSLAFKRMGLKASS